MINRTIAARIANKLQTLATLLGCPIADLTFTQADDGTGRIAYIDPETGDFLGCGYTIEDALDNGIAEAARWITQPTASAPNPKHAEQRALDSIAVAFCTAIADEQGTAPLFHDADKALRLAIQYLALVALERPYVSPTTTAYALAYKAVLDAYKTPSTPSNPSTKLDPEEHAATRNPAKG